MNWHYSRAMPSCSARFGVWEWGRFVGVVLYGVGAAPQLARSVGVERPECMELVRVALDEHTAPVSRIVAISLRLLRKKVPHLRVVVSYADSGQGHHGGIYKAGGWVYLGPVSQAWQRINGKLVHPRTVVSKYGTHALRWLKEHVDPEAAYVPMKPKHKYCFPICERVRVDLEGRRKPYPTASVV